MSVTRSLRAWKVGQADTGSAGEEWNLDVTDLRCRWAEQVVTAKRE